MNRRSAPWVVRILLVVTSVIAVGVPSGVGVASTDPVGTEVPVDTANPFLPEDRDLTDCVGLVERPGCGSEERGGLHQNLVAIVMVAGLLLVFGRVAWGVRRGQRRTDAGSRSDSRSGSTS